MPDGRTVIIPSTVTEHCCFFSVAKFCPTLCKLMDCSMLCFSLDLLAVQGTLKNLL